MRIDEMMKKHRREELIAIYKFIESCTVEEAYSIIEEIRCVHDNLIIFDPTTRKVGEVESVTINCECIQLNLEGTAELLAKMKEKCPHCDCESEDK